MSEGGDQVEPDEELANEAHGIEVSEAGTNAMVSEAPTTLPAADVAQAHLKGLIEALVFVAEHPISVNDIAKVAGDADRKLVRALVDELRREYADRGIHLDEVAGGLVFRTSAAYATFIRDLSARKPVRMTRAQLETIAIIAYRQPVTRPEVDEIRGVDSGPVLHLLLEREFIKILGKKDEPGRPLLYGTTPKFLEMFGLKSLRDLPSLREFTELSDDSRSVYERETGGPFGEMAAQALEPAASDTDADPPEPAPEGDGNDE
jgi:segregation and condensation protein B